MLFKLFLVISPRENVKITNKNNLEMELTGRIIAVLPAQSGVSARTGNNWMSQDYVIEVPGQFPRKCLFRIFGEDRIKQFAIQQGEDLTVQFDIDAHEFNGRWFNDIRAYNVIRGQVQQQASVAAPAMDPNMGGATSPFPPAQEPSSEGAADDLPF